MGVVGDLLYDFYFAIFSDSKIFNKIDLNYILSFQKELNYHLTKLNIVYVINHENL